MGLCQALYDSSITSLSNIITALGNTDAKIGFILTLFAYFIGFANHHFGSMFYAFYNRVSKFKEIEVEKATEKWTLAREFAQNHLPLLERWALLRTMSQNLATAAFLSFVFFVVKFFIALNYEWLILASTLLCFSYVFILRTRRFTNYRDNDLIGVIKTRR
jgi:hypothetical protein